MAPEGHCGDVAHFSLFFFNPLTSRYSESVKQILSKIHQYFFESVGSGKAKEFYRNIWVEKVWAGSQRSRWRHWIIHSSHPGTREGSRWFASHQHRCPSKNLQRPDALQTAGIDSSPQSDVLGDCSPLSSCHPPNDPSACRPCFPLPRRHQLNPLRSSRDSPCRMQQQLPSPWSFHISQGWGDCDAASEAQSASAFADEAFKRGSPRVRGISAYWCTIVRMHLCVYVGDYCLGCRLPSSAFIEGEHKSEEEGSLKWGEWQNWDGKWSERAWLQTNFNVWLKERGCFYARATPCRSSALGQYFRPVLLYN